MPPSRLARTQGKKIAKQSIRMILLTIVGAIVFVFVLLPQLVQLFFRIIGTGDVSFQPQDTIPPQMPVITPLPEATNEDSVLLEGFGEADSQVRVIVNGVEVTQVAVDSAGEFSYTLSLSEGENAVALYGIDEAGNESQPRLADIIRDIEAPQLVFDDLADGKEVTLRANQNLEIRGETEPGSQLQLNNRLVFVGSDGMFRTTYHLSEGDNDLEFEVTDKAGNQTAQTITVRFRY